MMRWRELGSFYTFAILAFVSAWCCISCLPPPQSRANDRDVFNLGEHDCGEVEYRDDLDAHPGCTTEGLTYPAAKIPGFRCAAKEYVANEDTSKPIVLLIHGNSDYIGAWESFTDVESRCPEPGSEEGAPMLSDRLMEAGFRTYAIDMRATQICEVNRCDCQDIEVCNYVLTMDHGWGVPLVMHLIQSVLETYPDRQISLAGHSFGVTVIRDSLRRIFYYQNPKIFERVDDVVLLSGGNHGVSSGCGADCCGRCDHMRGNCACEMGDRDAYSPTCFSRLLNGGNNEWESPCSDGQTAYGIEDSCGGHSVSYTTIVMEDLQEGAQKDLCVSQESAYLEGATNYTVATTSEDLSNYFYCGLLRNHFGSARSQEAIDLIEATFSD